MGVTYEPASKGTEDLIRQVMAKHHLELTVARVRVSTLMVHGPRNADGEVTAPALKLHGYPAAAVIKVTSLKERALAIGDALLLIDGDRWSQEWPEARRRALIDHELTHLAVKWDVPPDPPANPHGTPVVDDLGRPRLETRLHDWQIGGFAAVVRRHGDAALDTLVIKDLMDRHGQLLLPFMAPPGSAPPEVVKAPAASGAEPFRRPHVN